MAIQYSSSRILSRGGQRMGLRNFSLSEKTPGATGIVVLTTDAPFNWNPELIKRDPDTGKLTRRVLKPLRRAAKGLIYLRLPTLAAGNYTLAAKPVDVEESWIRLYVTDGLPPSPDQTIGHRIDSLGVAATGMVEILLADLEYLIGDTPLARNGGTRASITGGFDDCFINHTPGCTSSSTEDGDMPDNPGPDCSGGLGQEGDQPCGGSGIFSQDATGACAGGFDLACAITTEHTALPCFSDPSGNDVPPCIWEEPCSEEGNCGAPHIPCALEGTIPSCSIPSMDMLTPICSNPAMDTGTGPTGPCGILLGQPTHIFSPPSPCNVNDPFNCNLLDTHFIKGSATKGGGRAGLARVDLPDHVYALFGSRIEHRSVPAKSMQRLAEASGRKVRDLRLAIDLLNAAADVSLALFDEVQGRLQAETGNE